MTASPPTVAAFCSACNKLYKGVRAGEACRMNWWTLNGGRSCPGTLRAAVARSEWERLEAALTRIASWSEGPVVTGRFDEPGSAEIARAALARLAEKEGRDNG